MRAFGRWPWGVLALVLVLAGCSGQKSVTNLNNTFNFRSNAYMAAFQDGNEPWELSFTLNEKNLINQRNYTLSNPDGQYAVMYVCPSQFKGRNHEVYLYMLTNAEMRVSSHFCRVAAADRQQFNVSGAVFKAWNNLPPGSDELAQQMAVVALSRDVNMRAYEGYAAAVFGSTHDILAYLGPLLPDNSVQPLFYYRSQPTFGSKVNEFTIDFNAKASQVIPKIVVSAVGMTPATVSIQGETGNEILSSVFGFGSAEETFLPIVTSNAKSFNVTGVPPGFFTTKDNGQPAKEGHELHVKAIDKTTKSERAVVAFFDQPTDLTVDLPSLPTGALGLAASDLVRKVTDNQEIKIRKFEIDLPAYSDSSYGTASLYQLDLRGRSSYSGPARIQWPADSNPPVYVIVPTELEWHVYVSRGWLKAHGSNKIQLPDFSSLTGWDFDWDYMGGSQGKVALDIYASEQPAGILLSHLQSGEYINGTKFGKVQRFAELVSVPSTP
ncbi:MAG: hypothetical protein OEW58_08620 [Gammaproteobacteria bacterium]|nr:hypothetical protein [Gammaproteobacteria bacterium]